jgi:hypothetical protein
MASGSADIRTGKLKILAGPDALIALLRHAANECDVSVDDRALHWKSHANSPGATLGGDRIESVTQHDAAFVIKLKPGAGIGALTLAAASSADAADWVAAVKRIIGTAAAPQPPRPSRPVAAAAGETLAADPTPIKLTYTVGAAIEPIEKDYALLVVACDPRNLKGICDYSQDELNIFDQLSNFSFHTTLMKVPVPAAAQISFAQKHAVIFAPGPLEGQTKTGPAMLYLYRNETAKQFGLD